MLEVIVSEHKFLIYHCHHMSRHQIYIQTLDLFELVIDKFNSSLAVLSDNVITRIRNSYSC